MKSRSLWIVGIVALVGAAPAFARIDFTPMGVFGAVPFDMSDDGSKVVFTGYFGFPNIYWTANEGAVDLGGGCGAGHRGRGTEIRAELPLPRPGAETGL